MIGQSAEGQISMFDSDLRLNNDKLDCHDCICGKPNGYPKNISEPCVYWDCPGLICPEAAKRDPESNPDRGVLFIDPDYEQSYLENWCTGCNRILPIKNEDGYYIAKCYGATSEVRQHINHRYFCESYIPTTMHTEPCLLFPIQVWNLPDGSKKKWCAVCEANGCEDCYKQWERKFEEGDD